MKTLPILKSLLTLAFVAALSTSGLNAASGKYTAAHYKAKLDQYEGQNVTIEVPYVRVISEGKEATKGYRLIAATTYDSDNRSNGGTIWVVCKEDQVNKLVDKYGTNKERDGRRQLETKKLRGVLRVLDPKKKRDIIYLDVTGGSDPSDILEKLIRKQQNGLKKAGKKK